MADRTARREQVVHESHRQLRMLVREVAVLCRQPLADEAFYVAYLRRIVTALGASGAAIWTMDREGRAACRWQHSSPHSACSAPTDDDRRDLVQRAGKSRGGLTYRPATASGRSTTISAVYVPLRPGDQTRAVIEVFQPAADELAVRDRLRFVQHMALLASDRPSPPPKPVAARPQLSAKQLLDFIPAVHASLQLEQAAYNIVNELRRFLACDRVSLVRVGHAPARLLAVSGQDTFDRRADIVRRLTAIADNGSRAADALWFARPTNPSAVAPPALPPDAEQISQWRTLGIVPLRRAPAEAPVGVLVIEQIASGETEQQLVRRTQLALPHVSGAFHNAWEHSAIPLVSLTAALRRVVRVDAPVWQRRTIMLAAVVAIVLFLAIFPVPFQMHARGTLEPTVQRDVFAEGAGIVRTIHVEHGDLVQAGDVLVELHNSDLEVQLAQITGEQRAARESLAAVQRGRHDPRTPRGDQDRLAGEALRLQEQLSGLDEQHALLLAQRERLVLRSPIAGQVVTWNVQMLLDQRPVAVGQVLLTIADPHSPRELEVFLPEADMAHVAKAQQRSPQPLSIEYLAVTEPTVTHRGTLRQIDSRAQLHEVYDHSVRLLVDIKGDAPQAPAGTSVTARVDCGRRAIGYVWLHRLIGFVYTRILFHVS